MSPNDRSYGAEQSLNPDYWKPGRPYLDGIEYTIISDPSTAELAFRSGQVDMTLPYDLTVPMLNDVHSQMPQAVCELSPGMIPRHVLINRDKPPFDNPDLRRAMALSIDRKAFVDILAQGAGRDRRGAAATAGRIVGNARRSDWHAGRLRP